MPSSEDYDLDSLHEGSERLRDALPDSLPDDIAASLLSPGVPDWLRARPFEVVMSWTDLQGPGDGVIDTVPPELLGAPLPIDVTVRDSASLLLLYQRVLLKGSADQQRALLHPQLLAILWPALADKLPEPVVRVWEHRFPAHLSS
ncbi:hypothetical protein [Streptomyces rhizosphaericus]|uniref:hypothetical protein n=1 Tax=Streptomyces rhizosphaericus TaxID=114699 RepID=UPI00117C519C|nr:hypothetical protein [Streptomyces rhizosphaericus]